jgi:DNA-binding MarR family transcriptional regulator
MNEKISWDLIYNLFQLIKQFPPSKLKQKPSEPSDGLTQSEHELLMILAINHSKYEKALAVTEISNLLQITPAGVTHLINSLEESGCIERLQAPHDRRIVLVGLTDKGNQVAETYMLEVQDFITGLLNHLGKEDSQVFIKLLSRSIEYFSTESGS